jgi:2-polyprenyl-3-methyl-5-hydroxy-6-metoxy-1,4-benzoquinol methylase
VPLNHSAKKVEDFYTEKETAYFNQARTEIEPLLPQRAGRALEVGCGMGATMRWLRSRRDVQYAAGIEISQETAAGACDVFDRVLIGNAETLDIRDGNFDLIVILDVLEHLIDPWGMVQRLQAVLAPGGAIIASIPNVGHYSVCLPLLRGQWNYGDYGLLDRTHLRFFSEQTAFDLMTREGLEVQQVERVKRVHLGGFQWKSQKLRWYTTKLLCQIVPKNLMTFQYLIKSVSTC